VVNLVNGGKEVVNALCDHPQVRASVCRLYSVASMSTRRPASGNACNAKAAQKYVIVLPDATWSLPLKSSATARLRAASLPRVSVAVTIAKRKNFATHRHAASSIRVGNGLIAAVQHGP